MIKIGSEVAFGIVRLDSTNNKKGSSVTKLPSMQGSGEEFDK